MNNCLNCLSKVLKVPLNNNIHKQSKVTSQIFKLMEEAKFDLGARNATEKAEIQQFIEYTLVYASHIDTPNNVNSVLRELNGILVLKTYLVGYRLTVADLLLYYLLWNVMNSLTSIEQEKFVNVCRWFDNIQQDSKFRQSNKLIDFSTIYLSEIVPARH